MIVTPIEGEPDRFQVTSATDGLPWLVDLHPGPGLPRCACAIIHNRTSARWHCQHLRAVIHFLRHEKETAPANRNSPPDMPQECESKGGDILRTT